MGPWWWRPVQNGWWQRRCHYPTTAAVAQNESSIQPALLVSAAATAAAAGRLRVPCWHGSGPASAWHRPLPACSSCLLPCQFMCAAKVPHWLHDSAVLAVVVLHTIYLQSAFCASCRCRGHSRVAAFIGPSNVWPQFGTTHRLRLLDWDGSAGAALVMAAAGGPAAKSAAAMAPAAPAAVAAAAMAAAVASRASRASRAAEVLLGVNS